MAGFFSEIAADLGTQNMRWQDDTTPAALYVSLGRADATVPGTYNLGHINRHRLLELPLHGRAIIACALRGHLANSCN